MIPGDYNDEAEVVEALRGLSKLEITRLVNFGRYRLLKFRCQCGDTDAEDLFGEAILKTLQLRRKWRRGISLFEHLAGCISSIADNRLTQASRHTQLSETHLAFTRPPEFDIDAKHYIAQLRARLDGDTIVLAVMDTLADAYKPAEAQALLRIKPEVYWAARARIRRQVRKMGSEVASRIRNE